MLGGLSIETDAGSCVGAGALRRPLMLLAVLAVAGTKGVRREQVLLYFWGDSTQQQARAALRQTLFRLRRDLGSPDLVTGTDVLVLNFGVVSSDVCDFVDACDAGEFETMARLYAGPLLAGVEIRGDPELGRWLHEESARLAQMAATALRALAERAAEHGDHVEALRWWRRVARIDPLSSHAAAGIVAGLVATNDRSAAIRHGQEYVRRVRAELHTDADERVTSLLARVAAEMPPPSAADRRPPAVPPTGSGYFLPPPAQDAAAAPPPPLETIDVGRADAATTGPPAAATASAERVPARTRPRGRPASLVPMALAAVAMMIVVFATTERFRTAAGVVELRDAFREKLDAGRVVVAPFQVLHPDLALWSEGITDVLSHNLDGAGALRAVPPTVALRRAGDRADRASAVALGRATGAGFAIFGTLMRAGPDSVLATMVVVDVDAERVVGDVRRREATRRMDRLTEALTIDALAALRPSVPFGAVRSAAGRWSVSFDALRPFLLAEQFYRRAQWDSAEVYYARAIAADSTFALPLRRVGNVLAWKRIAVDAQAGEYLLRAGALNRGLGLRDSLLVTADSLGAAVHRVTDPAAAATLTRRLFATLEAARRQYPDDPEVWFAIGEARYHHGAGPQFTVPEREQLAAFRRAIELDSAFAPAYIHTTELALNTQGAAQGLRCARAYLALTPSEPAHRGARLVERVLADQQSTEDRELSRETRLLLAAAPTDALVSARTTLRRFTDPAESAVYIGRLLARGGASRYEPFADRAFMRRRLAEQLAFRGHLREAYEVLGDVDAPIFAELAILGAVPPVRADSVFAASLDAGSPTASRALPWWAGRRDTARIARLHELAARRAAGPTRSAATYDTAAAAAYMALARADTALALRRFEALPDSLCPSCYVDRLTRARLLVRRGRLAEAHESLRELLSAFLTPFEVVFALERASVAAALGRSDEAAADRAFATRAWLAADDAVRPMLAISEPIRRPD